MMEALKLVEGLLLSYAGGGLAALALSTDFQTDKGRASIRVRVQLLLASASALHVGFQMVNGFFE